MTKRTFPDDFIPAAPRSDDGKLTTSEIVAMAWDDETSFDEIKAQSGLKGQEVIQIMRTHMQPRSFRLWRERLSGLAGKNNANMD